MIKAQESGAAAAAAAVGPDATEAVGLDVAAA
jgi:hypothetical protein